MDTLNYKVPKDKFPEILAKLQNNNFSVVEKDGVAFVEGNGVKASLVYNPLDENLAINIIKKPFLATVGMIKKKIEENLG